jgi:hypothetical protein
MGEKRRRARFEAATGRRAGDVPHHPSPRRGNMATNVHMPWAQAVVDKKKAKKEKRKGQIGGLKEQQQRRRAKKQGGW